MREAKASEPSVGVGYHGGAAGWDVWRDLVPSALRAAPEPGEEPGALWTRAGGGLPPEEGVEVAVQGGEDQAVLLCIIRGAGRPSVCSSPARGLSSPQGDMGTRCRELPVASPSWWPHSSAGIQHEACRRARTHRALLRRCSGTRLSLRSAGGRCWPSSPAPVSPSRRSGLGHLYASRLPVPEPQPGLAEADQSVSPHRSK